ncbi:MAG: dihydroneopterin aldolase [Chitinophagales bacterium]|nr:dihydroneopterin aldolase [Chitinophagales bacterium]MBP6516046.1 dihydroneopterin aldolase [Chitinophagales bacterium]
MNQIGIEGMHFYAFHGVYAHEKETGAHYTVDVYIDYDFAIAGASDKVDDTINYEKVYKIAEQKMQMPSNLIEKVCVDILTEIKVVFSSIKNARVRVTKHSPPIKGRVDKVFVEKSLV